MTPDERKIVANILRAHVPDREVLVFGSRAKGTEKPTSDLDICIMGDALLPPSVRIALIDAFDVAPLPFKVDVVEWFALERNFQKIVRHEGVKFEEVSP